MTPTSRRRACGRNNRNRGTGDILKRDKVWIDCDSFENLYKEGERHLRAGGWDEAIRCFEETQALYPSKKIYMPTGARRNASAKEQAGPSLGWTSAVAACGAFIIPQVFGEQINAATPQFALYAFATFHVICLVLNWRYYLGPKREFVNP